MKNLIRHLPFSLLAISILFTASCKEDKKKDNCPEGRTGQLKIIATMVHHTRPIKGCSVFVKYNATEFPGTDTSKYDYRVKAGNDTAVAVIDSLNCGSYYIYAVGIDSLLDPANWIVKGGLPYSTSNKTGTVNLNVYITEGD